ncbi:hypothetical protein FBU30_009328 [Linnemannia zychae]|nr:hypothetical protein FBU30_009328 [Linnemannia zychae]
MSFIHPLELPEIIERIGRFLPLWSQIVSADTGRFETVFVPKSFLNCTLVSKIWRQTLLPILWADFDAKAMKDVPKEVLIHYSSYFKTFYTQQKEPFLDIGCTRLQDLTLYPTPEIMNEIQQMIQSNLYLKSLKWIGPDSHTLLTSDIFTHLSHLEILSLRQWDISDSVLEKTLAPLAGTIKKLDMSWNRYFEDETQNEDEPGQGDTRDQLFNGSSGNNLDSTLVLPLLESCRVSIFVDDLRSALIVRRCPNLARLDLTIHKCLDMDGLEDQSIVELTDILRDYCPNISSLVVRGSLGLKHKEALIQDYAATNSLTELVIVGTRITQSTINAIAHHASTLETLGILNLNRTKVAVECLFQPIALCPRLKWLSIGAWSCHVPIRSIVDTLKSSNWRCCELEILDIDFLAHEDEAAGDETVTLRSIFRDSSIQGWYYHPDSVEEMDDISMRRPILEEIFESVQGLKNLRLLRWCGAVFTRSCSRATAQFDGMPFILFD